MPFKPNRSVERRETVSVSPSQRGAMKRSFLSDPGLSRRLRIARTRSVKRLMEASSKLTLVRVVKRPSAKRAVQESAPPFFCQKLYLAATAAAVVLVAAPTAAAATAAYQAQNDQNDDPPASTAIVVIKSTHKKRSFGVIFF